MTTPDRDPPFTIEVDAGFNEDGVWVILVRATFNGTPPAPGSPEAAAFHVEALREILRATKEGRALNAEIVRVHLDPTVLGADPVLDDMLSLLDEGP